MNDTLDFYDANAKAYATREREAPSAKLSAFIAAMPEGGAVLDLGCGGGQDARTMLDAGLAVTASDGSAELARHAEVLLGQPVLVMRFEDLDFDAAFDGIWACASLLHAERGALPDIFARIHRALKPGGRLVASFKAGEADGHDRFGRFFAYIGEEELLRLATAEADWARIEITEDVSPGYDDVPTRWLWLEAVKAEE